jgi:hypothetical protein
MYEDQIKKIKHNKLGLNEEIKNHKNLNKKAKEKTEIKRRMTKLKRQIRIED